MFNLAWRNRASSIAHDRAAADSADPSTPTTMTAASPPNRCSWSPFLPFLAAAGADAALPASIIPASEGSIQASAAGPAEPGEQRCSARGQRPPQRQVARVLELGRDPAGGDQLGVEIGQPPPRDAAVHVVGQMPPGVVRAPSRSGPADAGGPRGWSGAGRRTRSMPACSAIARSRLSTRQTVIQGPTTARG